MPGTLELGQIPFFTNPAAPVGARLRLENVSTAGSSLLLAPGGMWTVKAVSALAQASEICVGEWSETAGCTGTLAGYDPAKGLAAGQWIDVPVRIAAASAGVKEWSIELHSNHTAEPTAVVVAIAYSVACLP